MHQLICQQRSFCAVKRTHLLLCATHNALRCKQISPFTDTTTLLEDTKEKGEGGKVRAREATILN